MQKLAKTNRLVIIMHKPRPKEERLPKILQHRKSLELEN
jgi:hypothetical protein